MHKCCARGSEVNYTNLVKYGVTVNKSYKNDAQALKITMNVSQVSRCRRVGLKSDFNLGLHADLAPE